MNNGIASSSSLRDLSEHRERKSHNKLGANQYKDRPLLHDPHVAELLNNYHARGFTDNRIISKLLKEEHNVLLGERSIYRRKKMLGLWASKRTTQELSDTVKRQLVMTQMAKDSTGKLGAQAIKKNIFLDTGLHLTRDYIRAEMKRIDPVSHAARNPNHNKQKKQQEEREAAAATAAAAESAETTLAQTTISPVETQTGSGNGQPSVSQGRSGSTQNVQVQRAHQPDQPLYNPPPVQQPEPHRQSSRPRSATQSHTARLPPPPTRPAESFVPSSYTLPPILHSVPTEPFSSFSSHTMAYSTSYAGPLDMLSPPLAPPLPSHNSSSFIPDSSSYHSSHSTLPDETHDDNANYSDDEPEFETDLCPPHHNEQLQPIPPTSTTPEVILTTIPPNTHPTTVRRSTVKGHVVSRLQDTTTNMQDLTRLIQSLILEDEALEELDSQSILQAMEAAALLERQLSRVISRARDSGTNLSSRI